MEAARVAEGLTVNQAMKLLGLSRSSYYRQVRWMKDYRKRPREVQSAKHAEVLREVALMRMEAGHRRVRAYAMAWGKISTDAAGISRMSCYRVLKSEALIQPKRIGRTIYAKPPSSAVNGSQRLINSTRCCRGILLIT